MAPKVSKADAKAVKASKADKPKVKRAPSPYILFCSDKRAEVKKNNPDATFGETGKLLGQLWATLTEKEKAVYAAQSAAKKAEL